MSLGLQVERAALWEHNHTQGVLVGDLILLSPRVGARKARFTVAHEIGHYILGTDSGSQEAELQADAIAAALLMPHPHVAPWMHARMGRRPEALTPAGWAMRERKDKIITALVRECDVSYATCLQTLADMGLVRGVEPWGCPGEAYSAYHLALRRMGRDASD